MKINNIYVYNSYPAIKAIRNATQTWDKSDTKKIDIDKSNNIVSFNHADIGIIDSALITRLLKMARDSGKSSHRKFIRQIYVSFELVAPKSFWSVFDSYKVGVATNSSNTFSLLSNVIKRKQKLELRHFEYANNKEERMLKDIIKKLNQVEDINLLTTLLPQSFLLVKSWGGSYENLLNIYDDQYKNEYYQWQLVIKMIRELPFMDDLIIPNSTVQV